MLAAKDAANKAGNINGSMPNVPSQMAVIVSVHSSEVHFLSKLVYVKMFYIRPTTIMHK